ncbi:MAG: ABC transporter permease [Gemmatimonadaceae bacterium]|nr:ABC transporter permease [Gemmatimonadaceae bacterium]MDQ3517283.1 ABC transporter permease [Gemmatimonadota bacterium]
MLRFVGRRAAQAIPLLLVVSLLVFALIHAVPGGPLALYLDNPNVRPEDIERLRRAMGLDRPLTEQYLSWLWSFVRGDWGYSYADGRPVMDRLLERVPATLELVGVSTVAAVVVALLTGTLSAVRRGFDRVATVAAVAGMSLPVFWFGLVLQLVFANQLGWLPSSGRSSFSGGGVADQLSHLVLPAAVLAAAHAAGWSRYMRGSMHQVLAMPFVLAARARGVGEREIVLRHALRHALLPFATVVLLDASIMASGAVVTESVFAWPGIGSLFTESLARRDYTVLMAFMMCASVAVVILSLVADVTVHALDPRTREDG